MKYTGIRIRSLKAGALAVLTAFTLACALTGPAMKPAFAAEKHEYESHGPAVRGHERHDYRDIRRHEHRRVYHRDYGYGYDVPYYGVYPPPVVYAPPPPYPGINVIVPLRIH